VAAEESPVPPPDLPPPAEPAAAPAAPAAGSRLDWPLLVAVIVTAGSALVLFRSLLPAKRDLAETLRIEQELEERREALREEERRLDIQQKALESDPAYMERLLRRQTDMTREGEILVR
jgi:cell division protein FtsB